MQERKNILTKKKTHKHLHNFLQETVETGNTGTKSDVWLTSGSGTNRGKVSFVENHWTDVNTDWNTAECCWKGLIWKKISHRGVGGGETILWMQRSQFPADIHCTLRAKERARFVKRLHNNSKGSIIRQFCGRWPRLSIPRDHCNDCTHIYGMCTNKNLNNRTQFLKISLIIKSNLRLSWLLSSPPSP